MWYYTFGVHCKTKFTRSHAHLFYFVKDPAQFTFNRDAIAVPSARQLVYGDKRANAKGRTPDDTWVLRPQDLPEGFSKEEDTWYFPRVAGTFKERSGFHGCQMPEQLLGRIIRACSCEGEIVLDPFSGSSTTLTVAKKLGRQYLGYELSDDYVKLGTRRLEAANAGDRLEGAEEPNMSAPATHSPKARRLADPSSKAVKKKAVKKKAAKKSVEKKSVEKKSVEKKSVEKKPVEKKPAKKRAVKKKPTKKKPTKKKAAKRKPVVKMVKPSSQLSIEFGP